MVEQTSLIIRSNYVISFQEKEEDGFITIRDRLRIGKGRIRRTDPDYLAYSLIDAIVDNYFKIIEKIGEEIETKDELIANPTITTLHQIHNLKR